MSSLALGLPPIAVLLISQSCGSSHCQIFTLYSFHNLFRTFNSHSFLFLFFFFFWLRVNLWLSLLSNTECNYYLCIQSPMKCTLSLISISSILNPLQQAERLLFLQHTNPLYTLPFLHEKLPFPHFVYLMLLTCFFFSTLLCLLRYQHSYPLLFLS